MDLYIFESISLRIAAFIRAKDMNEAREKLERAKKEKEVLGNFGHKTTIPGNRNFTIGHLNLSQDEAWYID